MVWFYLFYLLYADDIDRKTVEYLKKTTTTTLGDAGGQDKSWSSTALTVKWKHFLFLFRFPELQQHPCQFAPASSSCMMNTNHNNTSINKLSTDTGMKTS